MVPNRSDLKEIIMSNENENTTFFLDDTTIAQIAKLVQIAILTGTDVVDNLRLLEVKINSENGKLMPTEDHEAIFNSNLEEMLSKANMEQLKLF